MRSPMARQARKRRFRQPRRSRKRWLLDLGAALRFVWESAPGWTVASIFLVVVQGLLPLAAIYLMKLIVDSVGASLSAPEPAAAFRDVGLYVALAGLVALVSAIARSLSSLVSEAQALAVADHMYDVLHAKSVQVDLAYYESAQYFDTLHRAQREGPNRPIRIVNSLVQIGQNAISLLAMAVLLFSLSWAVAAVLLVAALPDILVRLKFADQLYRWQRRRTATERQAQYFSWLLTGSEHAKEVRHFGLGEQLIRRFGHLRKNLRGERIGIATRRSAADLAAQTISTLAIFGSYAYIAYLTVEGVITLGDLVMYFQAFQRGQTSLRQMMSSLAGLYENTLFLSYLYEFLELEPQVTNPADPRPIPLPMESGIELDHVVFQYPTGTRPVLKDICLSIRPGEHVALVGENGSGKTTLIKLLCRLYDPTTGKVKLDGIDLRFYSLDDLRRQISVVFQDYAQYHLTARENIWFGDVNQPPDQERIVAAARLANADEVITNLPHGYETILGKWFQDGEELSIGEWQKVALARAFLRESQIIVLDEPTSALDAKAEYQVFEKFRQLAAGRTAILISHRFSTVRLADRIYVLDEGRIVEGGTHDDLIRHGGLYAQMFQMQAQHYE